MYGKYPVAFDLFADAVLFVRRTLYTEKGTPKSNVIPSRRLCVWKEAASFVVHSSRSRTASTFNSSLKSKSTASTCGQEIFVIVLIV